MALKMTKREQLPGQKRLSVGSVTADVGLIFWFVFSLFPIIWMVLLALKNAEQQKRVIAGLVDVTQRPHLVVVEGPSAARHGEPTVAVVGVDGDRVRRGVVVVGQRPVRASPDRAHAGSSGARPPLRAIDLV